MNFLNWLFTPAPLPEEMPDRTAEPARYVRAEETMDTLRTSITSMDESISLCISALSRQLKTQQDKIDALTTEVVRLNNSLTVALKHLESKPKTKKR